jgi:hypothetical protein
MIVSNEYVIFKSVPPNSLSITKNSKQHVWCRVVRHTAGTIISIEPITGFVDYDSFLVELKENDSVDLVGKNLLVSKNLRVSNVFKDRLELIFCLFDKPKLDLKQTYKIYYEKSLKRFKADFYLITIDKGLCYKFTGQISNITEVDLNEIYV